MRSLPFWGVHVAAVVGVFWLGWSWSGVVLAVALYYARMFFLTAGFHRYFAHRSFKTSRAMQFVFAVGGSLAAQKGVLWWAANHRIHHRYADRPGDVHSPRRDGFWWSHLGWFLSDRHLDTEWNRIRDFARYPELRWLNRHDMIAPVGLAVVLAVVGGTWALVWGFFVSTVLLWHGTFLVNSLAHVVGTRRYETRDDSRNNPAIALVTMGEGWHNNHHRFPAFANQGLVWWEIDPTYYVLRSLEWLGVIWDLRRSPREVIVSRPVRRPPSPPARDRRAPTPRTKAGRGVSGRSWTYSLAPRRR